MSDKTVRINKKARITLRLEEDLLKEVNEVARADGDRSAGSVIRQALQLCLPGMKAKVNIVQAT